jgi:translation initiation factor IF-2
VKEVTKGYECGLQVERYNDIEVGDYLEIFKTEEVKRKL